MKETTKLIKKVGKFAATKSVNSASFFFCYQERETSDVKKALKAK